MPFNLRCAENKVKVVSTFRSDFCESVMRFVVEVFTRCCEFSNINKNKKNCIRGDRLRKINLLSLYYTFNLRYITYVTERLLLWFFISGAFHVKWNHASNITNSDFDENWLTCWTYGQKKNL